MITVEVTTTDEDLKLLSYHYEERNDKDAEDNLREALWGCDCCEDWELQTDRITDGVHRKILSVLIDRIEDYRLRRPDWEKDFE